MTDGRKFMEVDDHLSGAFFVPRVGDRVEFNSDLQTEKGPSAGVVIDVDRENLTAIIKHSDHPGETFAWGDVKVEYFSIAHNGRPFWMLR